MPASKVAIMQEVKSYFHDIDRVVDNMCTGFYQGLDFDKTFSQLFYISLPIVFEEDNVEILRFLNFIDGKDCEPQRSLFEFIQNKFMEKRALIYNAYN